MLDHDLKCRDCSYSLQGLPLSGRCPECGLSIAISIEDAKRKAQGIPLAALRGTLMLAFLGPAYLSASLVMVELLSQANPFFTLKGSFLLTFVMIGPTIALFSMLVVHRCFVRFHWLAIAVFCVFPVIAALISIGQFGRAIASF
jgi:hypothetical protein